MFQRLLNINNLANSKSVLLLGPRQTGKSTLLKSAFGQNALYIDLLEFKTFQSLLNDPSSLGGVVSRYLASKPAKDIKFVILDEIQKLPVLLDEVHRLIELEKSLRFILTGSSARSLRKKGTNLLGGRARFQRMHPLSVREIAKNSNAPSFEEWNRLCQRTGLPSFYESHDLEQELSDYCELYLKEEIQQEAQIRRLDAFSRFLTVAAGGNGKQIIFEKIGSKAGISAKVCKSYFEILEDTLIGSLIPSFKETLKRQPVASPKFYFFDHGLPRYLQGRTHSNPLDFGEDLETYLLHEIMCYRDYGPNRFEISYWRSKNQSEVDFVLSKSQQSAAIEIKVTRRLTGHDLSGLKALQEENLNMRFFLVNPWSMSRTLENKITVLNVEDFLVELWNGNVI